MSDKVCSFFKYGHCRYKERCRYEHVHEICSKKECSVVSCRLRHPRTCIFYNAFRRCKFGLDCNYKHETHETDSHGEDSSLLADIKKLEKVVAALQKENLELKEKIEAIDLKVLEISSVENKMANDTSRVPFGQDDVAVCENDCNVEMITVEEIDLWKKRMELCGENLGNFTEWSFKTP